MAIEGVRKDGEVSQLLKSLSSVFCNFKQFSFHQAKFWRTNQLEIMKATEIRILFIYPCIAKSPQIKK